MNLAYKVSHFHINFEGFVGNMLSFCKALSPKHHYSWTAVFAVEIWKPSEYASKRPQIARMCACASAFQGECVKENADDTYMYMHVYAYTYMYIYIYE